MKVKVDKVDSCRYELHIEVPKDRVKPTHEKVIKAYQKKAQIPGFRSGKAPLKIIESRFSKDIQNQILQEVIPEVYKDAIQDNKLAVVSEPIVDEIKYTLNEDLSFRARVDISPKVDLPKYKKLSLEKQKSEIGDKDIESVLEDLQARHATFDPEPERDLRHGDFAIIDYKTLEGGRLNKDNVLLQVRQETAEGDFDQQLIGLKPNDKRTVKMAAKDQTPEMTFEVLLKEIKKHVLPELTETFLKENMQVNSLEELKEKIREDLLKTKTHFNKQFMKDQIIKVLKSKSRFNVPQSQVEKEIAHLGQELTDQVKKGEIGEEKLKDPKLKDELMGEAEARVRIAYILHNICEEEHLEAEQTEIDERLEKIALSSGKPRPALVKELEKSGHMHFLKEQINQDKVIDFIIENAIIKEI